MFYGEKSRSVERHAAKCGACSGRHSRGAAGLGGDCRAVGPGAAQAFVRCARRRRAGARDFAKTRILPFGARLPGNVGCMCNEMAMRWPDKIESVAGAFNHMRVPPHKKETRAARGLKPFQRSVKK